MFDKAKDLYRLQKQAKQIKKELKNVHIEAEVSGVMVTINAEMEIISVSIPEETRSDPRLESYLTEAFNKAMKKAQKIAAERMKGVMGEMGFPGA